MFVPVSAGRVLVCFCLQKKDAATDSNASRELSEAERRARLEREEAALLKLRMFLRSSCTRLLHLFKVGAVTHVRPPCRC